MSMTSIGLLGFVPVICLAQIQESCVGLIRLGARIGIWLVLLSLILPPPGPDLPQFHILPPLSPSSFTLTCAGSTEWDLALGGRCLLLLQCTQPSNSCGCALWRHSWAAPAQLSLWIALPVPLSQQNSRGNNF